MALGLRDGQIEVEGLGRVGEAWRELELRVEVGGVVRGVELVDAARLHARP